MRTTSNATLVIFAALAVGCGDATWFGAALDARTEPTHRFWGAINGIKYRGRDELDRLTQQLQDAQQRQDLDAVAEAMQALGDTYTATAQRLDHLSVEDVDTEAVDFRDRYLLFHREAGELYARISAATRDRDAARIQELHAALQALHARAPQLRSEKDSLEAILSQRYDRDFNVVDHH